MADAAFQPWRQSHTTTATDQDYASSAGISRHQRINEVLRLGYEGVGTTDSIFEPGILSKSNAHASFVHANSIAQRGAGTHNAIWDAFFSDIVGQPGSSVQETRDLKEEDKEEEENFELEIEPVVSASLDVSQFCSDCRKVDFAHLYSTKPSHEACNSEPFDFNHVLSASSLDCQLCRFVSQHRQLKSTSDVRLSVISARRLLNCRSQRLQDVAMFGIFESVETLRSCVGHFALTLAQPKPQSSQISFRSTSESIDWGIVNSWTAFCEGHHQGSCAAITSSTVEGLLVIDCESRQLRLLPDSHTPYLTLSYVWGRKEFVELDGDRVPEGVPQLIEDAITAVISLGKRYLWVDRYCIPQNNMGEKHRFIKEMGRIFGESYMTLITAAGDDPTHGLPGISIVPRYEPSSFTAGDFDFVPVPIDLHTKIANSKWSTRGWTYQEALLSQRILVFTSSGLYFQCRQTRFLEGISVPLHLSNSIAFGDEPHPGKSNFFPVVRDSFEFIEKCIADFSCREFTFEEDVLDAFKGISEILEKTSEPISNICGVPFMQAELFSNSRRSTTRTECFANGLLWRTQYRSRSIGDGSWSTRSERKRACFPSWTWAGWRFPRGRMAYRSDDAFKCRDVSISDAQISFEFPDAAALDCDKDWGAIKLQLSSTRRAPYLLIDAWAFDIDTSKAEIAAGQHGDADRLFWRGAATRFSLAVHLDILDSRALMEPIKALILTNEGSLLLLHKASAEGHFERIGVATDMKKHWHWQGEVYVTSADKATILRVIDARREKVAVE